MQTTGRGEEAVKFSEEIPAAAEKTIERSPTYFSSTSTLGSPHLEESATQGSPRLPDPTETSVILLRREGYQGVNPDAGRGAQQTFGSPPEPHTVNQGNVDTLPAVTASTPLPLRCRACDAPQTVGTRPTATVCGHLFCSGYALKS